MNILVTICGRGGSKGVRNKNIRELAGKPLIYYTIDVAKRWKKADKIICSTDSEQIAKIAKKFGAEVPFMRPEVLATDTAGKLPVIRHALRESETIYKKKFDIVVDLDVTSPLRTPQDLDNCLKLFMDKKPEVLFSVVEARKNPYFNMVELNKNGYAEVSKKSEKDFIRRQDVPKVYDMNASIYFFSRDFLLNDSHAAVLSSKRAIIYVMDNSGSIDIDSEIDFRLIEFLMQNRVVSL
jgi:CMP-N,N'-diacetyllegionaminic acid synthase